MLGCIADNTGTGLTIGGVNFSKRIVQSRLTNNTTGVSIATGNVSYENWNYINNNTTNTSVADGTIYLSGGNSVVGSGTDGYKDPTNNDYTLTAAASVRREDYNINTANTAYVTAGIPPDDSGGGGGVFIYDD